MQEAFFASFAAAATQDRPTARVQEPVAWAIVKRQRI
jgi:hypothetical protein